MLTPRPNRNTTRPVADSTGEHHIGKPSMMYDVFIHGRGRKVVRNGPMQGVLDFPANHWERLTSRPLGFDRAKQLADLQDCHAVVAVYSTSQKIYDNGKPPYVPQGWRSPQALTALEPASLGYCPKTLPAKTGAA